jgi:hypothetical protein
MNINDINPNELSLSSDKLTKLDIEQFKIGDGEIEEEEREELQDSINDNLHDIFYTIKESQLNNLGKINFLNMAVIQLLQLREELKEEMLNED